MSLSFSSSSFSGGRVAPAEQPQQQQNRGSSHRLSPSSAASPSEVKRNKKQLFCYPDHISLGRNNTVVSSLHHNTAASEKNHLKHQSILEEEEDGLVVIGMCGMKPRLWILTGAICLVLIAAAAFAIPFYMSRDRNTVTVREGNGSDDDTAASLQQKSSNNSNLRSSPSPTVIATIASMRISSPSPTLRLEVPTTQQPVVLSSKNDGNDGTTPISTTTANSANATAVVVTNDDESARSENDNVTTSSSEDDETSDEEGAAAWNNNTNSTNDDGIIQTLNSPSPAIQLRGTLSPFPALSAPTPVAVTATSIPSEGAFVRSNRSNANNSATDEDIVTLDEKEPDNNGITRSKRFFPWDNTNSDTNNETNTTATTKLPESSTSELLYAIQWGSSVRNSDDDDVSTTAKSSSNSGFGGGSGCQKITIECENAQLLTASTSWCFLHPQNTAVVQCLGSSGAVAVSCATTRKEDCMVANVRATVSSCEDDESVLDGEEYENEEGSAAAFANSPRPVVDTTVRLKRIVCSGTPTVNYTAGSNNNNNNNSILNENGDESIVVVSFEPVVAANAVCSLSSSKDDDEKEDVTAALSNGGVCVAHDSRTVRIQASLAAAAAVDDSTASSSSKCKTTEPSVIDSMDRLLRFWAKKSNNNGDEEALP